MRKFILQITKFMAVGILMLAILISATNYLVRKKASFKINNATENIILGHSHPESAFDDSMISNFANFSNSGESYFYTYFKIVKLLEQNKQIKNVFLEFSNGQIDEVMDEKIWEEKYMTYRYPLYAPFMNFDDEQLLLTKNFSGLLRSLATLPKKNLLSIASDCDYTKKIGGYLYLERDRVDYALASLDETREKIKNNPGISQYTLDYLQKIVDVCDKNNVKIYFIRSPLHPQNPGLINEPAFQKILSSRFQGIEFLDFKDYPLDDSEFGDLDHLNFRGARKFSPFFDDLIKNGLLEKSNKQEFINIEMEKLSMDDKQ